MSTATSSGGFSFCAIGNLHGPVEQLLALNVGERVAPFVTVLSNFPQTPLYFTGPEDTAKIAASRTGRSDRWPRGPAPFRAWRRRSSASPSLACSCSAWSRVPPVDVQFATRPSQQVQDTQLKRHEAGVGSQT